MPDGDLNSLDVVDGLIFNPSLSRENSTVW